MRKLLVLVFVLGLAIFASNNAFAQGQGQAEQGQTEQTEQATVEESAEQQTVQTAEEQTEQPAAEETAAEEPAAEAGSDFGHQLLKRYFIEGSWEFMSLVLI